MSSLELLWPGVLEDNLTFSPRIFLGGIILKAVKGSAQDELSREPFDDDDEFRLQGHTRESLGQFFWSRFILGDKIRTGQID